MLTDRQQQVASLVCDGLSNKIIAQKLGVSEGTVKIHLHAVYNKLNIHSRTQLAATLADRGQANLLLASPVLATRRWRHAR